MRWCEETTLVHGSSLERWLPFITGQCVFVTLRCRSRIWSDGLVITVCHICRKRTILCRSKPVDFVCWEKQRNAYYNTLGYLCCEVLDIETEVQGLRFWKRRGLAAGRNEETIFKSHEQQEESELRMHSAESSVGRELGRAYLHLLAPQSCFLTRCCQGLQPRLSE